MNSRTIQRSGRLGFVTGWQEEWRQVLRDKSLLVMLLFLPVLYAVTVYWLYQTESVVDCPIIVVDQDGSPNSNRLSWLIDATEEVHVTAKTTSTEDAFARLRRHEAAAVVFVPEGFGVRLSRDEQAKIKLWIDSANMLTYSTTYLGIRNAVTVLDDERTQSAFVAKGLTRRVAQRRVTPIAVSEQLLYHPTGSYGAFLAPAVFIVALQQAILLAFAVSAGNYRETESRGKTFTWPSYPRLIGRLCVHLPFHLMSSLLLVGLMRQLYPFPIHAGFGLLLLLFVFVATTSLLAIVVALPFTNGRTPLQVLVLLSTPLFLASGYAWPIESMPRWVRWTAESVPSTPALAGLRTLGMKTADLTQATPAFTSLALLAATYAVVGLLSVTLLKRFGKNAASSVNSTTV